MKHLLLFLVLLPPALLYSQNKNHHPANKERELIIIGTVADASTIFPIEYASVFISGTTIGTTTNKEGKFELVTDPDMKNILVASSIGYESKIIPFTVGKRDTIEINIKLQQTVYHFSPIDISSEEATKWKRQFWQFKTLFLGTGKFANDCEIVNKYKIDFVELGDKFLAVCNEPIVIINKALGYKIECLLSNFELDREKEMYYCVVYPHFTEIIPSTADSLDQIKNNRLEAYNGSIRQLLKELIVPRMFENKRDFDLNYADSIGTYQNALVDSSSEIVFKDLKLGDYLLSPQRGSNKKYFWECNALTIAYKGSVIHKKSKLFALNPDGIRFNKKGFLLSPKDFILEGDMGKKRIADLLPDNWQPPQ